MYTYSGENPWTRILSGDPSRPWRRSLSAADMRMYSTPKRRFFDSSNPRDAITYCVTKSKSSDPRHYPTPVTGARTAGGATSSRAAPFGTTSQSLPGSPMNAKKGGRGGFANGINHVTSAGISIIPPEVYEEEVLYKTGNGPMTKDDHKWWSFKQDEHRYTRWRYTNFWPTKEEMRLSNHLVQSAHAHAGKDEPSSMRVYARKTARLDRDNQDGFWRYDWAPVGKLEAYHRQRQSSVIDPANARERARAKLELMKTMRLKKTREYNDYHSSCFYPAPHMMEGMRDIHNPHPHMETRDEPDLNIEAKMAEAMAFKLDGLAQWEVDRAYETETEMVGADELAKYKVAKSFQAKADQFGARLVKDFTQVLEKEDALAEQMLRWDANHAKASAGGEYAKLGNDMGDEFKVDVDNTHGQNVRKDQGKLHHHIDRDAIQQGDVANQYLDLRDNVQEFDVDRLNNDRYYSLMARQTDAASETGLNTSNRMWATMKVDDIHDEVMDRYRGDASKQKAMLARSETARENLEGGMAGAQAAYEQKKADMREGQHEAAEAAYLDMVRRERGGNEGGYRANQYDQVRMPEPVVAIEGRAHKTMMRIS